MEIEKEEKYSDTIYRLLEYYPLFEKPFNDDDICDEVRIFLTEDLDACYSTLKELKFNILHVSVPTKAFSSKKISFSEKLFVFLYSSMIKFCRTNKVKRSPLCKNFIENLKRIMTITIQIHHSYITGKLVGYAHSFCNAKVRENYHKVTVIAHNLFRFDFFFLLKGLRAGVWRTRDLTIGGKNPTDINFTSIGNQIQFLDTIKYFQQSLGALANSLTDQEKSAISRECENL